MAGLEITIEFGGGAESLFGNQKKHKIILNGDHNKWTIQRLLSWMTDNMLTGEEKMFIQNNTIRPGILILINDSDWELLGELEYELQPKDNITFISTLHGG